MSAAEKLRALEPRIERLPGGIAENLDSYEAKRELAAALPQIVALVDAAERAAALWDHMAYDEYVLVHEVVDAAQLSLAALNEALS